MDILKNLNIVFRIDAFEDASDEKMIKQLLNFSEIIVPQEYLEVIRKQTEVEIAVNAIKYIRIWGAEGCIEMNEAYNIQTYIPQSLAIGDDEGGNAIIYATGIQGFGLYAVAFNDLEVDEMKYISESLEALLIKAEGIHVLENI